MSAPYSGIHCVPKPVAPSAGSVLAIGELLWDMLPAGPRLGGAPFNAIAHLAKLGHPTAILSAVGDDALGRRARAEVKALGVRENLLQTVPTVPTGTVAVELDAHGLPTYAIDTPAAYEQVVASADVLDSVRVLDPAVVILGTLAQRSPNVRASTDAVLTALPDAIPIYDVNLRRGCWTPTLVADLIASAKVLKLNDEEVANLGPALGLAHADEVSFAVDAARRFPKLMVVCVTRGSRGAFLWSSNSQVAVPGMEVLVADTVGAGDAFTAGLVHGLLSRMALADCGHIANALGALVATRPGAIPDWTHDDLAGLIGRSGQRP